MKRIESDICNKKKVIGIPYYGKQLIDSYREGVGVYTKHLVLGMMESSNDLSIEVWCYHNNLSNVQKLFQEVVDRYPQRIAFLDEFSVSNKSILAKIYMKYYRLMCKLGFKDAEQIPRSLERKYSPYPEWMRRRFYYTMLKKSSKADWVFYMCPRIECWKKLKKPNIVQVHDLFTITYRDEFAKEIRDVDEYNRDLIERINCFMRCNTTIVCSSNYTKYNQCLKYVNCLSDNDIKIVPLIPMIKKFDGDIIDSEKVLETYHIEKKYIFYPTQNRTNKNILTLLKALDVLKKRNRDVVFVTTGKMSSLTYTEQFVQDHNLESNIIEVGSVTDRELYALYKGASVLVSTSYIEGSCISGQALEALSIGEIPVISALNDGIEERLEMHGLTFDSADLNWFDRFDYMRLAELIEDVLSHPQKHIEKQRHIIDAFNNLTWAEVANQYVQIYRNMETISNGR